MGLDMAGAAAQLSAIDLLPVDPLAIPTSAQVPIPPGTFGTLADLNAPCGQCQRCGLGATRTKVVISRGNPQADLMIIGEGPGENEDRTGLPFVGPAGQLLDRILGAVKLDPAQDVYIANIVKCRPPGNRKPSEEEMAACVPYLREQIRLVDPKLLVLMGGTAVQGLLGTKTGITRMRGTWLEYQGRPCLPMFHPSYLLRNASREKGSPKWWTWQDIQSVRAKYDELCSEPDF